MNPWVLITLWVSYQPADFTGREVPIPAMGMVSEFLTHRLPVQNPTYRLTIVTLYRHIY